MSSREIAAFNTHFDHVGKVARRESAVLILEKIKQMAGDLPVIVTGDLSLIHISFPRAGPDLFSS